MSIQETRDGRAEAGFTLVEALISIVVLVFGLLAITNLMLVAASSNSVGNQSTATAAVASQTLENLKAVPFATLAQGGSVTADATGYFQDDVVPGVGVVHTRWQIVQRAGDRQTLFIHVVSEPTGGLLRRRARADFTTFRTCTTTTIGCPAP
jgi:hypothetical protein